MRAASSSRADSLFEDHRVTRAMIRRHRERRRARPIATQKRKETRHGVAPIKIILIGNTYCLRIMPSSHGRNTGWLRNLYVAYDVFRVALVTLRIRDLPSGFMKNADSRDIRDEGKEIETAAIRVLITQSCIPRRVTRQIQSNPSTHVFC